MCLSRKGNVCGHVHSWLSVCMCMCACGVCVCVVWTVGRGGAGVWETVGRSERILAPVGDGMKQRAQRTHETDKFTPNTDMQATVIGR